MKKYSSAFTLLELIIVIAILAILATIAFVAYEGYTMSSRDSQRASNIRQIETALSVFRLKSGFYPMPEPKVSGGVVLTGSINNITYSYLGVIGDAITSLLQAGKAPIDPVTNDRYLYGISSNGKYFQISVALEKPNHQARVLGDYPGYMKFTASDNKTYIANIPSLLWNNGGSITLFSTGGTYLVAPYFVVNDQSNLPYALGDGPIGNIAADTIVQSIAKSEVATLTGAEITNVKTVTGVVNLFSGSLLMSFGGDIEVVKMNVLESSYAGSGDKSGSTPITSGNSCATQPSYIHATFTAGTPTITNQAWVQGGANCGYVCVDEFTGADCSIAPICLELENAGDFAFEEATKTITTYNGSDTDLIIPCKIGGVEVTGIWDEMGMGITQGIIQLTSVKIPNSITSIGPYAFYDNNLTSITIPSGVNSIGGNAFAHNKLTSVKIPNGITSIEDNVFYNNLITSVTIPSSVTSIKSGAFYGNQLASVTIPNSVTSIGPYAFNGNQLPDDQAFIYKRNADGSMDATTTIGYGWANKTPIIPNSVTTIGDYTFTYDNITDITIPNSVTSIGRNAFNYNLLTNVTIPDSVITIGDFAFYVNKLTSVTISNTVTNIGSYTFGDNLLASVTIPSSVTNIGGWAFTSNKLTSIIIPNTVTKIESHAFEHNLLTSVTIPSSITNIERDTFANNKLTSVTIPDSVKSIGVTAFANNLLTSVTIPNGITTIEAVTFANNLLTSVTIPSSVTSIGGQAFANNQLTSATIPSSVTSIGSQAFNGNKLPDDQAFIYKRNANGTVDTTIIVGYGGVNKTPVIPSSVKTIEPGAFCYNQLTSVTIPSGVTSIGSWAFGGNGPSGSGDISGWVSWVGWVWNIVGSSWVKQ